MAKRAEDRYPTAQAFMEALAAAHLQHNGGMPITSEDNERTVLAFKRPPPDAGAVRGPEPRIASGSNAITGSGPEWLPALAPELLVALSTQIGPVAKLVLKNAARDALDLDDLCARLLPHIGSEAGRAEFQGSVRQIGNRHGLSTAGTMGGRSQAGQFGQPTQLTGMPTLLQLSPELMEAAQQKLAAHVGPIAKVLVKRASRMTGNADEFYRLLAENVPDPQDRTRFLREVGGGHT